MKQTVSYLQAGHDQWLADTALIKTQQDDINVQHQSGMKEIREEYEKMHKIRVTIKSLLQH